MSRAYTSAFAELVRAYQGSDGDATAALYVRLQKLGPSGQLAINLFRAHKSSARAPVSRGRAPGGGSYRGRAYERTQWALDNLTSILIEHGAACGIRWGWGIDVGEFNPHVLYVELPSGQVSFHNPWRGNGPDYAGVWDGMRGQGADRICRWAARLLCGEAAP